MKNQPSDISSTIFSKATVLVFKYFSFSSRTLLRLDIDTLAASIFERAVFNLSD